MWTNCFLFCINGFYLQSGVIFPEKFYWQPTCAIKQCFVSVFRKRVVLIISVDGFVHHLPPAKVDEILTTVL
jgi:hypothetical protein